MLECPMCEMSFKKLADLKEHVRTHAVNGVYTCPHCPKVGANWKIDFLFIMCDVTGFFKLSL